MITTRIGLAQGNELWPLASAMNKAIREYPQASHVAGIVLIGLGDPYSIRPGDPTPRIALPLAASRPIDPIAHAQALAADGLVFLDSEEAGRVLAGREWHRPVGVLASGGAHEAWQLFRGIGVFENASAMTTLRSNVAVRGVIDRFREGIPEPPIDLQGLAVLTAEVCVAALRSSDAPAAE